MIKLYYIEEDVLTQFQVQVQIYMT